MKDRLVLYPFLFAIYPILFLYYRNADQFLFSDVWILLGIVTLLTFILVFFAASVLKSRHKAGFIVSFFLVLFFSYSRIFDTLPYFRIGSFVLKRQRYLMVVLFILIVGTAFLVIRSKRPFDKLTKFLNLVASTLVVISLFQILFLKTAAQGDFQDQPEAAVQPSGITGIEYPDIYHIILDGYARADVLREIYQYDNSEFLQYLESKGFFVARQSLANYAQTSLSLASTLNYQYLDEVVKQYGKFMRKRLPLKRMIQNSRVFGFLKAHGYTTIAYQTGYAYTDLHTADIYIRTKFPLKDFHTAFINTTPLAAVEGLLGLGYQYDYHRKRIATIFEGLLGERKQESPYFMFAHILAPHPPFVFGPAGEEINPPRVFSFADGSSYMSLAGASREEYKRRYIEQLEFVSGRMKEVIDFILGDQTRPAVIILQADHGPGSKLDWPRPEHTNFKERLAILNAYYFPGEGGEGLYPGISPVNTFKVLFNRFFGTDLKLSPDESFHSTWKQPFNFINVTDEITIKEDTPR